MVAFSRLVLSFDTRSRIVVVNPPPSFIAWFVYGAMPCDDGCREGLLSSSDPPSSRVFIRVSDDISRHMSSLPRLIRRRGRVILVVCFFLIVVYVSGLLVHPFEKDFQESFSYPLDLDNFREIINRRVEGLRVDDVKPINSYNFPLVISNEGKCSNEFVKKDNSSSDHTLHPEDGDYNIKLTFPRLVLVIKSSLPNRANRDAIRKTWGREDRFIDVPIRRVFVVGSCRSPSGDLVTSKTGEDTNNHVNPSCQRLINQENDMYQDIVQADFIDSYYNNTIKTMVGLKWLVEHCPETAFAFFVDDDYYVSIRNLLHFTQDPFGEDPSRRRTYDGRLYAGFVFNESAPMRHQTSKWYISLDEYPFHLFPPYVTAGAYVLSNRAAKELFYASQYTRHFRFDDIFMGLLAKKIDLKPLHSNDFYFWKKPSTPPESLSSVIASHGYGDASELMTVWSQQQSRGTA